MNLNFDDLRKTLQETGARPALADLSRQLRDNKDFHALFYALLLGKRFELGLPAVQVGSSETIPESLVQPYEDAIREAARTVGRLYLEQDDIAAAWPFFRMIAEPAPVAEAIDRFHSDDAERVQSVIDIALHQGANPKRGFELVVQRYGLCNAITTLGQGMQLPSDVREHCIKTLVRELYRELQARIQADIDHRAKTQHQPEASARVPSPTIRDLIKNRDDLFEDEAYHIDTSHLSSIVQFSIHLPTAAGEGIRLSPLSPSGGEGRVRGDDELHLAIELCEYGSKLSPRLQYPGEPPFEVPYRDYGVFLKALAGIDVEQGIAHFRSKAENMNADEDGTLPAEVLVMLLSRLNRHKEAVAAYQQFLSKADARQLNCPSIQELCQRAGDYRPLVEISQERGDLVNFLAGLMQTPSPH